MTDNLQTGIENTQPTQDNLNQVMPTTQEPTTIETKSSGVMTASNIAQPIPAQKQLPSDTYLYANTSNLGGVIQSTAKEYDIDPHKLEALMYNIQSGQAELSGYYAMSINAYPGMPAEAYTRALGQAINLANTVSEDERIDAMRRGEQYTANGIDSVIDSLVSKVEGKTGRDLFQTRLQELQQVDNVQFDTIPLTQYYENLVKGGTDKGSAWLRTMNLQDEYRKTQGYKAVKQDLDMLVTPAEMQQYTADLYNQIQESTDAEERLRLYDQWEAATKLAKSYAEAYKNDPATYLQTRDPAVQSILMEAQETGNFSDVIKSLDERYDEYDVPYSQRKYLSNTQADTFGKEINTYLYTDPIKSQNALLKLVQTYGSNAGKILNQLVVDKKMPVEAKILVEAAKTGNALTNEAAIDMLKHKATYKQKYYMEMFGTPDTTTANTLREKMEQEIVKLPGVKALIEQFQLTGDVQGQEDMLQYYSDMAAFYKYKNPRKSDKDIAKMLQENLISSIYAQDADNRVTLAQRTLDGKPILYNGYGAEQATNYLSNMQFTGQELQVGGHSAKESQKFLRDKSKIKFITLNQYEVQPVYDDGNGTVLALFKGEGENRKTYKINLKHLGNEDILGVFDARDNARKLYKVLNTAANLQSLTRMAEAGYNIDANTKNAYNTLKTLGFQIDKFNTHESFAKQFERTGMSSRRVQALDTLLKKQVEFETELTRYENMKKTQRDKARPRLIALQLVGPFISTMLHPPKNGELGQIDKHLSKYMQDKEALLPALKEQRVKLQMIEKTIMDEACIFLNYKGKLPRNPLTKEIHEHNLIDKALWGGYGY